MILMTRLSATASVSPRIRQHCVGILLQGVRVWHILRVRVELHRVAEDDYETLHSSMEEQGCSRFITSTNGVRYHPRTAEYNANCNDSLELVLDAAKGAAATALATKSWPRSLTGESGANCKKHDTVAFPTFAPCLYDHAFRQCGEPLSTRS
jgi:hypothetical protein